MAARSAWVRRETARQDALKAKSHHGTVAKRDGVRRRLAVHAFGRAQLHLDAPHGLLSLGVETVSGESADGVRRGLAQNRDVLHARTQDGWLISRPP